MTDGLGWYDPDVWIKLSERLGFPAAIAAAMVLGFVLISLAVLKITGKHVERLTKANERLTDNNIEVNTNNSKSLATVSTAIALSHEKLETIHDSVLAVHGDVHGVRSDVAALRARFDRHGDHQQERSDEQTDRGS